MGHCGDSCSQYLFERLSRQASVMSDHMSSCVQTEPAVSVRADPDFTAAQSSDAAALQQNAEEPSEDHPPEFKSAARQEHMNEAAAIRRQMQVCAVFVSLLLCLRCT